MPTIEEIIEKYQKYSDEELLDNYSKIEEYTNEGKEALEIILKKRGGIECLKERIEKKLEIEKEVSGIKVEITELLNQGRNSFEIKKSIKSSTITSAHLEKIIDEVSTEFEQEKIDIQIKPRTILGSITGGFIGGTIGGIVWGIQMIYSTRMFLILVVGLTLLSYTFIKLFTRQSQKNTIVQIMTALSVIYSLILGQIIFEIFGHAGK
ncbi:MAG: hypothetical protein K1X92_16530 [Bacteroidia bacterium]|nr:hypothetical protein [Bacteroidia bacterium]